MREPVTSIGAMIGVVHLLPLPGSPRFDRDGAGMEVIARRAVEDARAYEAAGFHSLIIENAGDGPHLSDRDLGPETASAMAVVAERVRAASSLPFGVSCVSNGVETSLAVSVAAGCAYVRASHWVGAAVGPEGWIDAQAGRWLRYRKLLDGTDVQVFADIAVKQSAHAVMADMPLAEQAQLAVEMGADAVVVSGRATGHGVDVGDLKEVRHAVAAPLYVGSGATPGSLGELLQVADGAIIGSAAKHGATWWNPVDPDRALALGSAWTALSR